MDHLPRTAEPDAPALRRLVLALRAAPWLTVLLTVVYFVAVTVTHDVVQGVSTWTKDVLGGAWEPVVAALAIAAGGLVCWRADRAARRAGRIALRRLAWWGTVAAAALAWATIVAVNVELIHLVQYGLLAIPVLALFSRIGLTVLVVTLLGAVDEYYQYTVLHDTWRVHYDLNDVLLNLLGAGLGVGLVVTLGELPAVTRERARRRRPYVWVTATAVTLFFAALSLGALRTGHMALYEDEVTERTVFLLNRTERPTERWDEPEWGRRHHLLHPGAALAVCALLIGGYTALDEAFALPPDPACARDA